MAVPAGYHASSFSFGTIRLSHQAAHPCDSIVPSTPDGRLVVVFDSGFTLPQVPRNMADAIYGRVQGAEYNEDSEVWTVPYDQLINLSFKLAGIEYPVHPLDVSSSDFNMVNLVGDPVCIGTFQPITSDVFISWRIQYHSRHGLHAERVHTP